VYTTDTGTSAAQQLGVTATSGAVVTRVPNATPADKAGIEVGDVIVELGGQKVMSSADLGNVVRRHQPGEDVRVVVLRDSQRKTVTATLVERPTS
jgi:serine protease Do